MIIETPFDIGQIVYLVTDKEQNERLLTRITATPNGVTYCLTMGTCESWHYAMEMTSEKDIVKQLSFNNGE